VPRILSSPSGARSKKEKKRSEKGKKKENESVGNIAREKLKRC